LISRTEPGASAVAQRRRKWLEEEKCIVFLSDDDLCEMLQLREASAQPFDIIDGQLEDFFRSLTP
jgi:methyl coenzyme M reductase gamma subunit